MSVICTGCGKTLEVGEDYLRKKMRCPECGVIFELPAAEKRRPASSAPSTSPPGAERETMPELVGAQTAVKSISPVAPMPVVGSSEPSIPTVDEPQPSAAGEPAAQARVSSESPLPAPTRTIPEHKEGMEDQEVDEEDRCPVCNELLPLQASHCPLCGFLLPVGKKVFKVNQPLERHWEAGWPFHKRLRMFIVCQATIWTGMIAGSLVGENPLIFIFPWLLFTVMTAFFFGSYDRIDLTRNKRGKVRLKQAWRICFWPREPITHRLSDYEDLATGVANDFSNFDWAMTLFLFMSGMIPGIIYWFCTFHKDNYFVALCRDHGFPAVMLYRGWSEAHAQDMAKTICEVTGLPRRRI